MGGKSGHVLWSTRRERGQWELESVSDWYQGQWTLKSACPLEKRALQWYVGTNGRISPTALLPFTSPATYSTFRGRYICSVVGWRAEALECIYPPWRIWSHILRLRWLTSLKASGGNLQWLPGITWVFCISKSDRLLMKFIKVLWYIICMSVYPHLSTRNHSTT